MNVVLVLICASDVLPLATRFEMDEVLVSFSGQSISTNERTGNIRNHLIEYKFLRYEAKSRNEPGCTQMQPYKVTPESLTSDMKLLHYWMMR